MITYQDWVISEAKAANSDACTKALDWNVWCCYEHDLSCLYAKDPRDAYRKWKESPVDYWCRASYHRRRDADKRFWRCNRELDPSAVGKLRSDVRYIGVRIGALWPF